MTHKKRIKYVKVALFVSCLPAAATVIAFCITGDSHLSIKIALPGSFLALPVSVMYLSICILSSSQRISEGFTTRNVRESDESNSSRHQQSENKEDAWTDLQ